MIEQIKKYLESWETKNVTSMLETLHPTNFGIRTYETKRVLSKKELNEEILNSKILKYDIVNYSNKGETYFVKLLLKTENDEFNIETRFTFRDNAIKKVFEVIEDDSVRIMCRLSYDGSRYFGFQKQNNALTIQGTIEKALKEITKEDISIHASGRTDKGVHALNQVFHFDTLSNIVPENFYQLLNKYLPESIRVLSSKQVNKTFHSRYDVKTKEYKYIISLKEVNVIENSYEWFPGKFDLSRFKQELKDVIGTHNFSSFTKTNSSTSFIRTIYSAKIEEKNDKLVIYIKGNGFLRYMVRNIIAALIVISNKRENFTIKSLIKAQDNSLLRDIAPSNGLYLNNVEY
jgi:tRNA pseudouridine38-40 synthase